ncbi:hypothetical protein [Dyella choica]|uniref:Uncharacterized protein n=1 Tax=Dyella choica TaxID=1927959 RepID=A0A432MB34_9GAMM|nr:hypothetical protein [Dyella choica]RUL79955.1 hypothetical protein EKH80_01825 [Dyella choica]
MYLGAVVGDMFCIGGSIAEVFGGELAGELINCAGILIAAPFQVTGGAIDSIKEESELKNQAKEYLKQANELGNAETRDKPDGLHRIRSLGETGGLDDKTIDALVDNAGVFSSSPDKAEEYLRELSKLPQRSRGSFKLGML